MYCKIYINYRGACQISWFMFQTLQRRSALAAVFSCAVWVRARVKTPNSKRILARTSGTLTAVSPSIQVSLAAQHSKHPPAHHKLAAFAYHPSRMLAKRLPRCSLRPTPRFLTTSRSLRAGDPLHTHPGSSGGHHGDHYDPPGGWLWGLRPGEKYEKEGWEGLFYYGFYGSFVVAAIAYAFKPDTS